MGHRLELRQRAAELGAALHVVGRQVAGAGHDAGGGDAEPGHGQRRAAAGGARRRAARRGRRRGRRCARARPSRTGPSRVTPWPTGSTSATTTSSPSSAGTRSAAASAAYVTPILRPVTRPSSIGGRGALGDAAADLADRRGQQRLAGGDRRAATSSAAPRCRGGQGERAAAERLPHRQLRGAGAGLAEQLPDLGRARGPRRRAPRAPASDSSPACGERRPVGVPVERLADHRTHGLARIGRGRNSTGPPDRSVR